MEELPTVLPAALSGLEELDMGFRPDGFTGSRLGDWLLLSKGRDSPRSELLSAESAVGGRTYVLPPVSAGLRNERVRESPVDIL